MKKIFPEYHSDPVFGLANDEEFTKADAALSTDLLWTIVFEVLTGPYCKKSDGSQGFGRAWSIKIEDQHDDEPEPHYVLHFGESTEEQDGSKLHFSTPLKAYYCDNKFGLNAKGMPTVTQAPGVARIYVAGDFGKMTESEVKSRVADVYRRLLRKYFTDYFIAM